jgi:hypothetical protein
MLIDLKQQIFDVMCLLRTYSWQKANFHRDWRLNELHPGVGRFVRKLDVMTSHIITHTQKPLFATDLCLVKYFYWKDTEGQCSFLWCEIVRNMDRVRGTGMSFIFVSMVMGEGIWASFSSLELCGVQYATRNLVF